MQTNPKRAYIEFSTRRYTVWWYSEGSTVRRDFFTMEEACAYCRRNDLRPVIVP